MSLAYCANVLIENRNGLVVDTALVIANGTAERDAVAMAERIDGEKRVTRTSSRVIRERAIEPDGPPRSWGNSAVGHVD